jgi:SpoVK/Ycf46/Vps4 family AAA+-type ATPase
MDHFSIIQALCRSALSNPSSAVIQQIERLKEVLKKEGKEQEANSLEGLLRTSSKAAEMAPSRIERSRAFAGGEKLTPQTPVPVDKETSTPLAEVFYPEQLPTESPLFSSNVMLAIESVVNEWQHYDKLSAIDAQPSRSCLIYGEPGTGKTHLALWLARQIGLPVVLARLDGLMSSYLGTTSRNIGNLFQFASRYRCILLLDEFDAIAKLRNDPQEVGEIKRVVNTLLQSLDARKNMGFTIGVTNHEQLLDPAIWRRFDVQLEIPKPTPEVMHTVIRMFLNPLELDENEIKFLAWSIDNASGADAEMMVKWLKKSIALETGDEKSLVEKIKKFALLNSGRINSKKRTVLTTSDDEIAKALSLDTKYEFKQKDIASLLDTTPSRMSKLLSKTK